MSEVITFVTQADHFRTNPKPQTSMTFNFTKNYLAPPRVVIGLNRLDMQHGTNFRVKAYADGIDRQTFTAHAETWGDSTLNVAGMDALILKPANLDILSGEFNTRDDHPSTRPQRFTSRRINFERPFLTPPKVVVFLKSFETGPDATIRVLTYVSNIDAKGFTIHVDTWADTTLYTAVAGWVAHPEDKDYFYSGIAHTQDIRPWHKPQLETQGRVHFRGAQFLKKPTIFMAFNYIDVDHEANPRIKAYADNVSTEGMTWHIDGWADTTVWAGGVSYIAFH